MKFPPAQPENTVYFRVIDHDDESPYETDTTLPDNYEAIGINGVGLHTTENPSGIGSSTLSINAVNTLGSKTATCYLQTTNRYSGDNYKVEASLDPNFSPGSIVETSNLVAWKRAYVDVRYMWTKGSYVTLMNGEPAQFLIVKNTLDFEVGDRVVIFANDDEAEDQFRTITSLNNFRINFDEPINPVAVFAGVKKNSTQPSLDNLTLRNGLDFVVRNKDGFGYNGNGDDSGFDSEGAESGGGFVEFIYKSKRSVPHLRGFEASASINEVQELNKFWHAGHPNPVGDNADSHYTLVIGRDIDENNNGHTVGTSIPDKNVCFIATEIVNSPGNNVEEISNNSILNTIVHELAHQFRISAGTNIAGHVDANGGTTIPSNDTLFPCIMRYGLNNELNANAEFCSHHNHGLGGEDNSCLEDIRKETWPN